MWILCVWSAILYLAVLGNFINHELKDLFDGKEQIEEEEYV